MVRLGCARDVGSFFFFLHDSVFPPDGCGIDNVTKSHTTAVKHGGNDLPLLVFYHIPIF